MSKPDKHVLFYRDESHIMVLYSQICAKELEKATESSHVLIHLLI